MTRKRNRLQHYDYSQDGVYFVTLCSTNHSEIFGKVIESDQAYVELTPLGKCINDTIELQNKNGVTIDQYVIMPNHIHLLIAFENTEHKQSLHQIVRNIKSFVTKSAGFSPWQKSFHDHVIRNERQYLKIAEYIQNNPGKWSEDCYHVNAK